jgi:hypothetical protein
MTTSKYIKFDELFACSKCRLEQECCNSTCSLVALQRSTEMRTRSEARLREDDGGGGGCVCLKSPFLLYPYQTVLFGTSCETLSPPFDQETQKEGEGGLPFPCYAMITKQTHSYFL